MNDLFESEDTEHPPRRHRRVREDHARIIDLLIEISVGELPVGDGREIRADAPRRPDVVSRNQMAARTRGLGAREEKGSSLLHIAGDAAGHRDAPNRGLRARVSVGVGPELAEVPGRPTLVAHSLALAVPQGLEAALRLGNGPAAPCWDARVIGSVSGAGGTARDQSERAEPLYQRRPRDCHQALRATRT